MRPPDLPGGNAGIMARAGAGVKTASMRPPDLPGGNDGRAEYDVANSGKLQ